MSFRFHITIEDKVGEKLARWAKHQGRPMSNLASHLIEKGVNQANAEGLIPPPEDESSQLSPDIAALIAKLIDGKALDPEEEERLARACDRNPITIHLVNRKGTPVIALGA